MEKTVIKISVRSLIEFILRAGDIDSRFVGSKRALEGTRLHKKIQKSQKENYKAEVSLKYTIEKAHFSITIEGRVDGIIDENGSYCIDEIKTTTANLEELTDDSNPVYWGQAQCYAYIFSQQNQLPSITIRLTYCQIESEMIRCFNKQFSFTELQTFFDNCIDRYLCWAQMSYEWAACRNDSIKTLKFPFESYRKGQRELAVSTYRTITGKGRLFVNAPTGIGKTVSTLFPSIKALAEGHTSKIFYLTAKTITRSVAEETVTLMRKQMVRLKTITLTAKEKVCFKGECNCQPMFCEFAGGHFDRINTALWEILNSHDEFKRETIEEYARKHRVCPFEYALDLTLFCDVIICDYNYVFDPRVYLKRFFSDNYGDYTFLIDEAHNLVDRSRDMFSAVLCKSKLASIKKISKDQSPAVYKAVSRLITLFNTLKKQSTPELSVRLREIPEDLEHTVRKLIEECELFLVKNRNSHDEQLLQLYFDALLFIKIAEFYDEHFITILNCTQKDISVTLFCIDPSFLLSESLKRGSASIFFSATLSPLSYHREVLGGTSDDTLVSLQSPFDVNNRCLICTTDISTRFSHRDTSVDSIVQCIKQVIDHRTGNYLIFFPSYSYMNAVAQNFQAKYPSVKTIVQTSSMSEPERESFLNQFQVDPQQTLSGFCVLGGLFSEGIDLKSDRLIGAIIVGVGLPQICPERDYIKEYFHEKNGSGYEYAYVYPGMNKVLQAAGRVIRSENDRGVIVLIDDRFVNSGYQSLFPREWFPHKRVVSSRVSYHIREFWKEQGF